MSIMEKGKFLGFQGCQKWIQHIKIRVYQVELQLAHLSFFKSLSEPLCTQKGLTLACD